MMNIIVVCLAACLSVVFTEPTSVSDVTWPRTASKDCNGTQQSPIDIVTANVRANANLTAFNFTGYDDKTTLTEIKNTGEKIEVHLDHTRMHVEGGDLPGLFASTHFHFHWGNGSAMPGSEHTVDGKRYAMELHVVNKAEHDGSVSGDPELSFLGFFIEASNDTGKPTSWNILTSYLKKIANAGDTAQISHNISMEDLISGVDRTKYYRYLGSLTSPNCEGVVWTIFKDPVKVSQDLIDLFSTTVYINETTNSTLMTNTFRGVQPINGRIVMSQVAGTEIDVSLAPTMSTTQPTSTPTTTSSPTSTPTTMSSPMPTTTSTTKPTSTPTTTSSPTPTTTSTTKPTSTPTTTSSPMPTTTSTTKPTSTPTTISTTTSIKTITKSTSTATNKSRALICSHLSLVLLYCILS